MKTKSKIRIPTESRLISRQFGSGPRAKAPNRIGAGTLSLMTVGGIMGSGLFLASGSAIRLAGPAIAVSFLIGVTAMALEVALLAEMAAADPARGSFLAFARDALGPGPAFVGGWIFWFSSVLNLAAEATAGAIFARVWFPDVPVYIFSMGFAVMITGINFLTVKGFSSVEAAMSLTKILVTALFILVGGLAVFHVLPARAAVGPHLWSRTPGFFPHGVKGVAAAMILVLFSLSGTGVLGLAAPSVDHPERTIGSSLRNIVVIIYVLYVGAALTITGLLPWFKVPTAKESPFIAALTVLPWGWMAAIFNLVILIAVLSAMNAGLFATNRVLATLGRIHDAPFVVARESHGIPRVANVVTGILLVAVSGLDYLLPKTAYLYLVTATGFQALFIWILIVVTEIYYRPQLARQGKHLLFKVPGHPWTGWATIVLLSAIIATAPLAPHELPALALGAAAAVIAAIAYLPVRARRRHGQRPG